MERQLKSIRINDVEYYADPVNFYIKENIFEAGKDTLYLGNVTLLNPDKTTDMSNGQTNLIEVGTWTPKLKVVGGSATHDIGAFDATFTKVGDDLCYVRAFIYQINTTGTPSGSLNLTGLPFPVMHSDSMSISVFRNSNLTADRFKNLRANTVPNDIIQFRPIETVVDSFTDITFNNGAVLISGLYKINTSLLNSPEPQK